MPTPQQKLVAVRHEAAPTPEQDAAASAPASAASLLALLRQDVPRPDFDLLPDGVSDFDLLRRSGQIYVDKTALIYQLTKSNRPVFIARPRRFGKSLLCSTLACLFSRGTELFKGLAIAELWHEETYPTIRLSFDGIEAGDESYFLQSMSDVLNQAIEDAGLTSDKTKPQSATRTSVFNSFFRAIDNYHKSSGGRVVLILDEYDAAINAVLHDSVEIKNRLVWYREFFARIKQRYSAGAPFRFIFITGVTRYAHSGIFSGFHIVNDLSSDDSYSALFGYTQSELEHYFGSFLRYNAFMCGLSFGDYCDKLRRQYDGYLFCTDTSCERVYNPWSILLSCRSLENRKSIASYRGCAGADGGAGVADLAAHGAAAEVDLIRIAIRNRRAALDNYWIKSGVMTSFLLRFCQHVFNRNPAQLINLMGQDFTCDFSLPDSLFNGQLEPQSLFSDIDLLDSLRFVLYLCGYYTIAEQQPYDLEDINFRVPNNEIRYTLQQELIRNMIKSLLAASELTGSKQHQRLLHSELLEAAIKGTAQEVLAALNRSLYVFAYDTNAFSREAFLRSVMVFLLQTKKALPVRMLAELNDDSQRGSDKDFIAYDYDQQPQVIPEQITPTGRADIFVHLKQLNLVFELKLAKAAGEAEYQRKLDEAISQIRSKRYYDYTQSVDTHCFAIVFSRQERRAVKVVCFTHYADGTESPLSSANAVHAAQ